MFYYYKNTTTGVNNDTLRSTYYDIHTILFNLYFTWNDNLWSDIIHDESIKGKSCLHKDILYFNIALDLVWSMYLHKIHIPSVTKHQLYKYFDIKNKAIFLQRYNIDLYAMLATLDSYIHTYPKFGLYYNKYAIIGNLAPIGTHIPSLDELDILASSNILDLMATDLENDTLNPIYNILGWDAWCNQTNNSKLTMLPAGYANEGVIWADCVNGSAPLLSNNGMSGLTIYNDGSVENNVGCGDCATTRLIVDNKDYFDGMTITDIDGNVYGTTKIHNIIWTTSNLKTTHFNNGVAIDYQPVSNTPNHTDAIYAMYQDNVNNV